SPMVLTTKKQLTITFLHESLHPKPVVPPPALTPAGTPLARVVSQCLLRPLDDAAPAARPRIQQLHPPWPHCRLRGCLEQWPGPRPRRTPKPVVYNSSPHP